MVLFDLQPQVLFVLAGNRIFYCRVPGTAPSRSHEVLLMLRGNLGLLQGPVRYYPVLIYPVLSMTFRLGSHPVFSCLLASLIVRKSSCGFFGTVSRFVPALPPFIVQHRFLGFPPHAVCSSGLTIFSFFSRIRLERSFFPARLRLSGTLGVYTSLPFPWNFAITWSPNFPFSCSLCSSACGTCHPFSRRYPFRYTISARLSHRVKRNIPFLLLRAQ